MAIVLVRQEVRSQQGVMNQGLEDGRKEARLRQVEQRTKTCRELRTLSPDSLINPPRQGFLTVSTARPSGDAAHGLNAPLSRPLPMTLISLLMS